MKESLKVALHLCQQCKRFDASQLSKIWDAGIWESLQGQLAESTHYKGSPSLQNSCMQIVQVIRSTEQADKPSTPLKRKKDAIEGPDEEQTSRKEKRKKVLGSSLKGASSQQQSSMLRT